MKHRFSYDRLDREEYPTEMDELYMVPDVVLKKDVVKQARLRELKG